MGVEKFRQYKFKVNNFRISKLLYLKRDCNLLCYCWFFNYFIKGPLYFKCEGIQMFTTATGYNLITVWMYLEHWVIWQVLHCKLSLASIARVCFPEYGVSISWHHLASLQCLPNKLLQLVISHTVPQLLLHLCQKHQHLERN